MREITVEHAMIEPIVGMIGVIEPSGHLVGDGPGLIARDILGQASDSQALLANDLAFVGLDFALRSAARACSCLRRCDPARQTRSPGSICELDLIEQTRAAEGQTDVSQAQQCHEIARTGRIAWVMDVPVAHRRFHHGNRFGDRASRRRRSYAGSGVTAAT